MDYSSLADWWVKSDTKTVKTLKLKKSFETLGTNGKSCNPNSLHDCGNPDSIKIRNRKIKDILGSTELLTFDNPKTLKNQKLGIATAVLHLAPSDLSGHNVCPKASPTCIKFCLHTSGNPAHMPAKEKARIKRAKFYVEHQALFFHRLRKEISDFAWKAYDAGMIPSFRLNGTSDQPKIAFRMAREFANVQMSDYTKILGSLKRKDKPDNYHLTFSRSESNWHECLEAFKLGFNVAAVVDSDITDAELRQYLSLDERIKIISGDEHDATFLHDDGLYLLRLIPKGKMRKDESGMRIRRDMLDRKPLHQFITLWKNGELRFARNAA